MGECHISSGECNISKISHSPLEILHSPLEIIHCSLVMGELHDQVMAGYYCCALKFVHALKNAGLREALHR